jgi:hypothetical protein
MVAVERRRPAISLPRRTGSARRTGRPIAREPRAPRRAASR